ncbi:MAG: hypothetical protein MUO67_25730 [Anaerolineales bacterium]|jgi:hypothetical protein|nr:hypothetical protein [Anaerolineales bacterium]
MVYKNFSTDERLSDTNVRLDKLIDLIFEKLFPRSNKMLPFLDLGSPLANAALVVGEILFLGVFIYLILVNLDDIIGIVKKGIPVLVFAAIIGGIIYLLQNCIPP